MSGGGGCHLCRFAVVDNARLGEPDARVSQVDRARWRHRPDVDRVAQHCHGRQQGSHSGEQRAHLTDAVDAHALRDQSLENGNASHRVASRHPLH